MSFFDWFWAAVAAALGWTFAPILVLVVVFASLVALSGAMNICAKAVDFFKRLKGRK